MPSSLPIELLRLILDNFACPPISNDGTLVNPHRHELLPLCLTSKIFRQIAQPLLFVVVCLEADKVGNRLSGLLSIDREIQLLSSTRTLIVNAYSADDTKRVSTKTLIDLSKACALVEQIVLSSCSIQLSSLSGASLTKLSLNGVDLQVEDSTFAIPNLFALSLVDVELPEQGLEPSNFPSLRHFAFDQNEGMLTEGAGSTLMALKEQVHSISLVFGVTQEILDFDAAFPLNFVLVDYLGNCLDKFDDYARDRLEHARIRLDDAPLASSAKLVEGIDEVSSVIEDQAKSPRLRTIYLPPLHLRDIPTRPVSVYVAIERLILACRNRKIEIVHEEQRIHIKAETQMSEEFMRRMTKERIERERIERESLSGK